MGKQVLCVVVMLCSSKYMCLALLGLAFSSAGSQVLGVVSAAKEQVLWGSKRCLLGKCCVVASACLSLRVGFLFKVRSQRLGVELLRRGMCCGKANYYCCGSALY